MMTSQRGRDARQHRNVTASCHGAKLTSRCTGSSNRWNHVLSSPFSMSAAAFLRERIGGTPRVEGGREFDSTPKPEIPRFGSTPLCL